MADASKRPDPWKSWWANVRWWLWIPFFFEWVCEWIAYGFQRWAFLEVLEYVARLSVLVAVILFFLETDERRKAKHYQAWQVLNSAEGKGGSGGRIDALQDLAKDGVSLAGINLSDAVLPMVDLREANLIRANLSEAVLAGADLSGATLLGADLRDAYLFKTDLREAYLSNADLSGADLRDADQR